MEGAFICGVEGLESAGGTTEERLLSDLLVGFLAGVFARFASRELSDLVAGTRT